MNTETMSTKQTLTGFTPGKWEFATFEPGKISGLSAGGIAIHANWNNADGYQPLIATIQPHWSNSAHEANARLIAAAPELLEACKALLVWGGYIRPSEHRHLGIPTEKEAMEMALAAIAKAEKGEA